MTNREIISKLRKRIQEKDADSTYTNKFLYSCLQEHAKWLIKREISAKRIYKSKRLFQTRPCIPVIKASKINEACPIKTNCVVYRTRYRLDEMWQDEFGPLILRVTSIDGSTEFTLVSPQDYTNKLNDPYFKYNKTLYAIYEDGYIWFEDKAPKKINVTFYPKYDITGKYGCNVGCCEDCISFLDQQFMIPDWLEAEVIAKVLEQLIGSTKQILEDNVINKEPNITQR